MHKPSHQYSYIYFIFLIFIGIIGVCIYMGINWKYTPISIFNNIKWLITYRQSYSNNWTEKSIDIDSISSKRYHYTIRKEIEKILNEDTWTGMYIFTDIQRIWEYIIFNIKNKNIALPTKSYFFDILNKNTVNSISWELNDMRWSSKKKQIALTFDDGPSWKYTHRLLDILRQENVHVTFYVLGSQAKEFPEIIKREFSDWHEIGNHGYSHSILTKLNEKQIQEEIYKTDQAIYAAISQYPTTLRPPYGAINKNILLSVDMPAILWSIDTIDWKTHSKDSNIKSIKNIENGDIVIMHDIHESSLDSIPEMIKILKEKWFEFVTISELLWLDISNNQIGKICTKKWNCK